MKETTPSNGYPVCPGKQVVYQCITTTDGVIWHEDSISEPLIPSDTNPKSPKRFEFQVRSVNSSVLVSTATLHTARSNDTGILIECTEGGCTQNEVVQVAS